MDLPRLQELAEAARAANAELFEALAKAANDDQTPMDPRAEKKAIEKIMGTVEDHLQHEARFKSWDVFSDQKSIEWITQDTDTYGSRAAAQTIAKTLRKAKLAKGWTVKVVVRDDYIGDKTKWHSKVKV